MPLRDFRCESCGQEEERFYYDPTTVVCRDCGSPAFPTENLKSGRSKTAVFPFDLTIDGQQVTVTDIGALRAVERRFGVLATAFSQDGRDPDSPRDLPENRPGGRAYEGLRFQDHCRRVREDGIRAAVRAVETGRYR
jgi:hypothetical protein